MLYLIDLYNNLNYSASFIHSIGSLSLCLIANFFSWIGWEYTSILICKFSIWHSLIYFIADSYYFRNEKDGNINWTKIIHHLVCIFAGFQCLSFPNEALLFSINGLALHEVSNPFWSILRIHLDKKKFEECGFPREFENNIWMSKKYIGTAFVIVFGFCRFIIWPYYFDLYFPKDAIPASAIYYCIYPLFVISIYWFNLMVRGLIKNYYTGTDNIDNIQEGSSHRNSNSNILNEEIKKKNTLKLQLKLIDKQLCNKYRNRYNDNDLLVKKKIIMSELNKKC